MTTKVLIVDDSSVSRKMIKKSLPPEWDVAITEAANGIEALEQYKLGVADVMFLDLTMPELDGYGVLEQIQKDGLNSMIIVISADIQPEAAERVKKLGAMAFIKKPIDTEKLSAVLKEHGII
ncbi:MAG: response regulator [Gammaproteobacteria bacterium]|nr:response regulator [Gammaproteobacteria bacterium]